MSLSCSCDDNDVEPGKVCWMAPMDFSPLETKRSRKCCSCGERIATGATCCEFPRIKVPESDIEVRIYGEYGEIGVASKHMCERCADLYFSLDELGFCGQPWEDQRDLVRDYAEMYGPGINYSEGNP